MLRKPIGWHWHILLGVASFATLIALYTYASWSRQLEDPDDRVLPNWGQLYREGLLYSITPDSKGEIRLWEDLKVTFYRLFVGLALSIAVALPLGLLMGCYAVFEAYFLPPLAFLAKVPGTAMLAVFFIIPMIGATEWLFTAMIVFGIVPTLTQSIYHAAKEDVPEELLFKARTLGATQFACIWDVIYKHILPRVLDAVRLQVGPALIFLFAAEYIKGEYGLGGRLRLNAIKGVTAAPHTYFYVVCFGAFCLLIDTSLRWVQRKLCPWYTH